MMESKSSISERRSNQHNRFLASLRGHIRRGVGPSPRCPSGSSTGSVTRNTGRSDCSYHCSDFSSSSSSSSSEDQYTFCVYPGTTYKKAHHNSRVRFRANQQGRIYAPKLDYVCEGRRHMYWSRGELEDMIDDHKYEGKCLGVIQTTAYAQSLRFLYGDDGDMRGECYSSFQDYKSRRQRAIQMVVQHEARGLEKYACPLIREYRIEFLSKTLLSLQRKTRGWRTQQQAQEICARWSARSVQFALDLAQGDAWWVQEMIKQEEQEDQLKEQLLQEEQEKHQQAQEDNVQEAKQIPEENKPIQNEPKHQENTRQREELSQKSRAVKHDLKHEDNSRIREEMNGKADETKQGTKQLVEHHLSSLMIQGDERIVENDITIIVIANNQDDDDGDDDDDCSLVLEEVLKDSENAMDQTCCTAISSEDSFGSTNHLEDTDLTSFSIIEPPTPVPKFHWESTI